eukprot:TRINITY_DN75652_c0_g1_i1.p1 TRINITY_DN75652_c0_g1~~TRINITY_DN75652_c0_g1_i1.p1  ORF type:complete len:274 (+),score=24.44 TRINITY_DN75652_c0_g1_i1:91-822(+)
MPSWFSSVEGNRREEPSSVRPPPAATAAPPAESGSSSWSSLVDSLNPTSLWRSDAAADAERGSGRSVPGEAGSIGQRVSRIFGSQWQDLNEDMASTFCPSLTMKQRVIGFTVCFGIGMLLDLLSFGRLAQLLKGKAGRFAVMYTTGNIIALTGTFFLAGPRRQYQRMSHDSRWVASMIFLISMILTIVVASTDTTLKGRTLFILVCVVVQWTALVWYGLSYIPFGRRLTWQGIRRCLPCGGSD